MKNTKIILSAILFLSIFGIVSKVNAAAVVSISPTNVERGVGEVFNLSVNLNTNGNSVCAVEGTLDFKNLSCQSITLTNDLVNGSSFGCANPHFLIGIPNCTTTNKTLMTVAAKGNSAGTASMEAKSVDVIGSGVSISNSTVAGNYIISTNKVREVADVIAIPTGEIIAPGQVTINEEGDVVNEESIPEENVNADDLAASAVGVNDVLDESVSIWIVLLIVVVLLVIIYGIYSLIKKGKKNEIKTEPIKPITPQNQNTNK